MVNRLKLTRKKIKYFVRDEKKAVKEYRRYGLKKLARQEAEHKKYLIKRLKRVI